MCQMIVAARELMPQASARMGERRLQNASYGRSPVAQVWRAMADSTLNPSRIANGCTHSRS